VGTKRQGQENIQEQAERCGMPYVTQRWLGGTLTNFRTIRQRCDYLLELEKQKELGGFLRLLKKEALWKDRELVKLQRRFGGIKNMYYLPSAIFVADIQRESIAIKEANAQGIPVVAMVDTNCDPDPIDYVIPANDDAIRAIKLMATKIADAVIEGQQMRGVIMAEEDQFAAAAMAEVPADAPAAVDLTAEEAPVEEDADGELSGEADAPVEGPPVEEEGVPEAPAPEPEADEE
jgi:small subunit ribosomal protein S2